MTGRASLLAPSRLREGPGVGSRFELGRPSAEARELRNNATLHERLLWLRLKGSRLAGLKCTRQLPIAGYKADFACRSHALVVELDGGQYADAAGYDAVRTIAIEKAGYRVIRFWNNDLKGVSETIVHAAFATEREPIPQPPPASGRGGVAAPGRDA